MNYELILAGRVPAKKNSYTPRKGGRGFFKDSRLQEQLDRLALQIPGSLRDLQLASPDIQVYFRCVNGRFDRDNALTTVLDLLVEYGVLQGDTITRCNGTIILYPATKGETWVTTIFLTTREEPEKFREETNAHRRTTNKSYRLRQGERHL